MNPTDPRATPADRFDSRLLERYAELLARELFGELGHWWVRKVGGKYGKPDKWRIGWIRGQTSNPMTCVCEIVGYGKTPLEAFQDCQRQLLRKR
jgi:hypothetical protein